MFSFLFCLFKTKKTKKRRMDPNNIKIKPKVLFTGPVTDVACSGNKTFFSTANRVVQLGSSDAPFLTLGSPVLAMWAVPYDDELGPAIVAQIGERCFYEKSANGSSTGYYEIPHGDAETERESRACFTSRGRLITRSASLGAQRRLWIKNRERGDMLFAPGEGVSLFYEDMAKVAKPLPVARALKQLRPGVVAECYVDRIVVRTPFVTGQKTVLPELEEDETITGAALGQNNELFMSTTKRLISVDITGYLRNVV
jgi:hypothetical protein